VGLFSVQWHSEHGRARAARRVEPFSVRFRPAAIAATNDARIVGILLVLAALALGLEMAASFHLS
jgi:hypothetical protein